MKVKTKEIITEISIATAKGTLSAIPFVGPLLAEYLGAFVNVKSKQRFDKWAQMVEEKLEMLNEEKQKMLEDNELFYSNLAKATQEIIKTHQIEKMQMFANAIVDGTILNIPEERKIMFLNLLSDYTLTHMKILKSFYKQKDFQYEEKRGNMTITQIGYQETIFNVMCENNQFIKNDYEYVKVYVKQLFNDGLIDDEEINKRYNPEYARKEHLTKMGKEFLQFIMESQI